MPAARAAQIFTLISSADENPTSPALAARGRCAAPPSVTAVAHRTQGPGRLDRLLLPADAAGAQGPWGAGGAVESPPALVDVLALPDTAAHTARLLRLLVAVAADIRLPSLGLRPDRGDTAAHPTLPRRTGVTAAAHWALRCVCVDPALTAAAHAATAVDRAADLTQKPAIAPVAAADHQAVAVLALLPGVGLSVPAGLADGSLGSADVQPPDLPAPGVGTMLAPRRARSADSAIKGGPARQGAGAATVRARHTRHRSPVPSIDQQVQDPDQYRRTMRGGRCQGIRVLPQVLRQSVRVRTAPCPGPLQHRLDRLPVQSWPDGLNQTSPNQGTGFLQFGPEPNLVGG